MPIETELKIIENLKRLAEKLNKTPTKREYGKEYGNPGFERYGGYNAMVKKAGLFLNKKIKLSDEEILQIFKEYIEKNGIPTSYKFPKELPSIQLIFSRFGEYKNLLRKLGYDKYVKEYTRESVIKILQDGIDSGKIKAKYDLHKAGYPSLSTIYKLLKTNIWNEVLKIIDREQAEYMKTKTNNKVWKGRYNFTKEELKEKYITLSKQLSKEKRGASAIDIRKHLGFSENVFYTTFKIPLSELRIEWGYQPYAPQTKYTKEALINILIDYIKKNKRKLKIKEIHADKNLPGIKNFYREFKTRSFKDIYAEIEKMDCYPANEIKKNLKQKNN